MKEESFMLVSLKEENAKKLAQVITNDTCRKILEYLSKNKATETELSKKLNLPLSTVHYNLQQLVASKLVETNEFHYSEKGKEVIHYSLVNKYIIIAPKEDKSVFRKLRGVLPAAVVGFVGSVGLYLYSFFNRSKADYLATVTDVRTVFEKVDATTAPVDEALVESGVAATRDVVVEELESSSVSVAEGFTNTVAENATMLKESVTEQLMNQTNITTGKQIVVEQVTNQSPVAFWFFLGVVITISTFVIWNYIKNRTKQ